MDQATSTRKKKEVEHVPGVSNLQAHYVQEVHKLPGLMKLLQKATLRDSGQPGAIKSASDYSYSAPSYAGDHYRIAGDAGGKSDFPCAGTTPLSFDPDGRLSFHRSILFVRRPPRVHRRAFRSINNLSLHPRFCHRGRGTELAHFQSGVGLHQVSA